jgi:aryl-alcohol dehydrogenase-like predicted oxidoreductase
MEPGTLGLAWLLTRPAITAPIIGPRTRDQLDSALPAVELSLAPEHLRRLD